MADDVDFGPLIQLVVGAVERAGQNGLSVTEVLDLFDGFRLENNRKESSRSDRKSSRLSSSKEETTVKLELAEKTALWNSLKARPEISLEGNEVDESLTLQNLLDLPVREQKTVTRTRSNKQYFQPRIIFSGALLLQTEESQKDVTPAVVKRRHGRPSEDVLSEQPAVQIGEEVAANNTEVVKPAEVEPATPIKRGRGRPRKSDQPVSKGSPLNTISQKPGEDPEQTAGEAAKLAHNSEPQHDHVNLRETRLRTRSSAKPPLSNISVEAESGKNQTSNISLLEPPVELPATTNQGVSQRPKIHHEVKDYHTLWDRQLSGSNPSIINATSIEHIPKLSLHPISIPPQILSVSGETPKTYQSPYKSLSVSNDPSNEAQSSQFQKLSFEEDLSVSDSADHDPLISSNEGRLAETKAPQFGITGIADTENLVIDSVASTEVLRTKFRASVYRTVEDENERSAVLVVHSSHLQAPQRLNLDSSKQKHGHDKVDATKSAEAPDTNPANTPKKRVHSKKKAAAQRLLQEEKAKLISALQGLDSQNVGIASTQLICGKDGIPGTLFLAENALNFAPTDENDNQPLFTLEVADISSRPRILEGKEELSSMELCIHTGDLHQTHPDAIFYRFIFLHTKEALETAGKLIEALVAGLEEIEEAGLKRGPAKLLKQFQCPTCSRSWKNMEGLKYHKASSQTECNPLWTPTQTKEPKGKKGKKRRYHKRGDVDPKDVINESDENETEGVVAFDGENSPDHPKLERHVRPKAVVPLDENGNPIPKPKKSKVSRPRKIDHPSFGNTQHCKETVMKIIEANDGVFPGDESIFRALVTAWARDFPNEPVPDNRVCKYALDLLEDDDSIEVYQFAFSDVTGSQQTRFYITKPGVDRSDEKCVALRDSIKKAYPEVWIPEGFGPSDELKTKLEGRSARSKRVDVSYASLVDHEEDTDVFEEGAAKRQRTSRKLPDEEFPASSMNSTGLEDEDMTEDLPQEEIFTLPRKRNRAPRIKGPVAISRAAEHTQNFLRTQEALRIGYPEVTFLEPNTHIFDEDEDEYQIINMIKGLPAPYKAGYPVIRFQTAIVLSEPQGYWDEKNESSFDSGSFSVKGSSMQPSQILEQHLPMQIEDLLNDLQLIEVIPIVEVLEDSQYSWFVTEISKVAHWEQVIALDVLQIGTIAPNYRFINHKIASLERSESAPKFDLQWVDMFAFGIDTIPYDDLDGNPSATAQTMFPLNYTDNWDNFAPAPKRRRRRAPKTDMLKAALQNNIDQGLSKESDDVTGETLAESAPTFSEYAREYINKDDPTVPVAPASIPRIRKKKRDTTGFKKLVTMRRQVQLKSDLYGLVESITSDPDYKVEIVEDENKFQSRSSKEGEEKQMSFETDTRIMIAVVAISCLVGGVEKTPDWVLISRLFPPYSIPAIKNKWTKLYSQNKDMLDTFEMEFRELFLFAYENKTIPLLDYDNLLAYDWALLMDWIKTDIVAGKYSVMNVPKLPASRETIADSFTFQYDTKQASAPTTTRDSWFDRILPISSRVSKASSTNMTLLSNPFHTSLPETQIDVTLTQLKSWLRATLLAPPEIYSTSSLSMTISTIPRPQIQHALSALCTSNVCFYNTRTPARTNTQSVTRGYELTRAFNIALNTAPFSAKTLIQAAEFKAFLDVKFRVGEKVILESKSNEGVFMATMNLQASGRIKLEQQNVPMNEFGLIPDHQYANRLLPLEALNFGLELAPTEMYVYDADIDVLENIKTHQPPIGEGGILPLWRDVDGGVMSGIWKAVVGKVVGVVAERHGVVTGEVERLCVPLLEQWEVEGVLEWGRRLGVVKEGQVLAFKGGWEVDEWWWLGLGRIWAVEF